MNQAIRRVATAVVVLLLVLVAQLTYQHWGDYSPPTQPATLGTDEQGVWPPPRCWAEIEDPKAACFEDRVIPRLAAEWRWTGTTVHQPQPHVTTRYRVSAMDVFTAVVVIGFLLAIVVALPLLLLGSGVL